jgi:hypothetical protein
MRTAPCTRRGSSPRRAEDEWLQYRMSSTDEMDEREADNDAGSSSDSDAKAEGSVSR